MEALGPRACSGLAEEPSPTVVAIVDVLIALLGDILNLHVALFLSLGQWHGLLPFPIVSSFALLCRHDVKHLTLGTLLTDAYSFHGGN